VRATLVVLDIHVTIVAAAVAGKCGGLAQGSDDDGSGSGDEGGGDEGGGDERGGDEGGGDEGGGEEGGRWRGNDLGGEIMLLIGLAALSFLCAASVMLPPPC